MSKSKSLKSVKILRLTLSVDEGRLETIPAQFSEEEKHFVSIEHKDFSIKKDDIMRLFEHLDAKLFSAYLYCFEEQTAAAVDLLFNQLESARDIEAQRIRKLQKQLAHYDNTLAMYAQLKSKEETKS